MIYGDDDDTVDGGSQGASGRIYGGSGNDQIQTGDADFDVWGGPGDDDMNGASECGMRHAFGESGNQQNYLTK